MIGEKGRAFGLEFPTPRDAAKRALRADVPDLVSLLNPLDWNLPWASMSRSETSDVGLGHLMTDDVDLLIYFIDWPRQDDVAHVWWPTLEGLIQLNARIDQLVVVASVLPDGLPKNLRHQLTDAGLICLQGLDDTLAAIAAAGKYHSSRRAVLADRESRELSAPAPEIKSVIQVDEAEGKAALESCGLTIPRGLTGSSEDVIANAETLGYPLAVKLLSADLAHKNHAGAVHLNVGSKLALEEAVDAIKTSVGAYDPTLQTDRFLIERMVASPLAEFIVGVSYKPGLGHALIIGRGGTDVEELRDFAMLLLPVSAVQIEDALRRLNLVRKLRLEQQDIASLVQVVSQVAQFSDQYRERLVELDVNPIILDTFGNCTAVDAMMRIRS